MCSDVVYVPRGVSANCRSEPASEQGGAEESWGFSVLIPDSLLSVSRRDLVAEQRADPSLSQLFDRILTGDEGKSAANGYMLQDKLLVRKWMPHGENFVGDPVFQIVVPPRFRDEVLRTSHDHSRHLGVHKTCFAVLFLASCEEGCIQVY